MPSKPEFVPVQSSVQEYLLPCPKCGSEPRIMNWMDNFRNRVAIYCACYHEKLQEFPSLYEAVSWWQVTAKMMGSQEPAVDNDVPF